MVDKFDRSTNNLSVASMMLSSIMLTVTGWNSPSVPTKVNCPALVV